MSRHRAEVTGVLEVLNGPGITPYAALTGKVPRDVGRILTVVSFATVTIAAATLGTWGVIQHREAASAQQAADDVSSRLSAAVASLSESRAIVGACRSQLAQVSTAASASSKALAAALPTLTAAYDTGDTATFQNTLAGLKVAAVKTVTC